MEGEADTLSLVGYLGILGLFIGMIIVCFIWGIWEYRKPKDAGPLFIDLDRTITKRLRKRKRSLGKLFVDGDIARYRSASKRFEANQISPISDANETIRVRGDLRIPKGEVIPYDMVVQGNLVSQEDVTFQGGLHVKGRVVLGARNRLKKSIVCQEDLFLFEDVIVYNCIDCEGTVFIKKGVRVGVGKEGGGIASASKIYLENAEGPLRIHSKNEIQIIEDLRAAVPEELMELIEVSAP